MVLLQSGCLCCTMRGDLVDALETLLRDLDNGRCTFRRVLLETTGLADPAPVLHTAMAHPYLVHALPARRRGHRGRRGQRRGDARRACRSGEAGAVADRIVLTKTDLADRRASAKRIVARLRALNPAAPILDAATGEATAERLLDCGLYDPERKIPDVKKWLAAEAYADAHHARSPPSRRQPPRRAHRLLRAHRRHADPGRHARDVPRTPARDARRQAAAPQGHREARRDARHAGGGPRRAARLPPDRAARALAGRRPPHPPRLHHPRPARAHRARAVRGLPRRRRASTGRTARR